MLFSEWIDYNTETYFKHLHILSPNMTWSILFAIKLTLPGGLGIGFKLWWDVDSKSTLELSWNNFSLSLWAISKHICLPALSFFPFSFPAFYQRKTFAFPLLFYSGIPERFLILGLGWMEDSVILQGSTTCILIKWQIMHCSFIETKATVKKIKIKHMARILRNTEEGGFLDRYLISLSPWL